MAYDRYDTRNDPRGSRSRWRDERDEGRGWRSQEQGRDRGNPDERGFFERAGDEIASWFGDDDPEQPRSQDRSQDERGDRYSRSYADHPEREFRASRERDPNRDRGGFWGERQREPRESGYRPMTGDYGRSERSFSERGNRGGFGPREDDYRSGYGEGDRFQHTSFAGSRESSSSRHDDPHYSSWRQRHMDDLDRDFDDYRKENQSRFENDFGSWRERRMQKRSLLGQVREHFEVVGSDEEPVGTVDRVAGDRIILTKSDPESGGSHHSLSCSDVDRVEGEKVILDCKADEAKERWRDESRSRALFEREDQGEMGPRILDRSFEGTYR